MTQLLITLGRGAAASLLIATVVVQLASGVARADQVRDWMVAPQPPGTYLNTDIVFPGLQAQLEHRIPIYGLANELDLKVNALPTVLYYESQADVELRVLILTLGISAGFRDTFFNLAFAPGEAFDHGARNKADSTPGRHTNELTGYGDGRVTLSIPFNDYVALLSVNGARYEGGGDRTFDWRLGIVRDAGVYLHSNTTLFFHHRSFGALGPQLEVLRYKFDGHKNLEFNYGFTYVGRMGWLRRRFDMLYVSALIGVTGKTNGEPTYKVYGDHYLKVPLTVALAYRMVWELWTPKKYGEDE